jgi:hypothetical protein
MKTPGELIEEGVALIAQGLFRTSEQNGLREARLLCDAVKATLSVMWMDLARQGAEAKANIAEAGCIVSEVLETLKSSKSEQAVTEEPGTIERHDFGSKAGDPDWCYLCGEHRSHPAHAESQRPYPFTLLVKALRNIDAEAPAKEPRDDWTSTDLDEAFYEGKLRGFWEMAVYAREALAQEGK